MNPADTADSPDQSPTGPPSVPTPTSFPRHRWSAAWRIPSKWLAFSIVTLVVLFPHPGLLRRHIAHLRNLQALVQPEAPELAAWDGELRAFLLKGTDVPDDGIRPLREVLRSMPPEAAQKRVEAFVLQKVKYAWDWDVWGMADYIPTVAEMFSKADAQGQLHEDCDGRAVMAASVMRRLGYESRVVTDLRHVWVATPQGEWMGPGRQKTIVSTPQGNKMVGTTILTNLPVSLSYGIAVFPLGRELLILAAAFVLSCHPRMRPLSALWGLLLLVQGLLFMRCGVLSPRGLSGAEAAWPAWVGMAHLATAFLIMGIATHRSRRRVAMPG